MDVSPATYDEIAAKLRAASYDHAFVDGHLDMHGIALCKQDEVASDTHEPNKE